MAHLLGLRPPPDKWALADLGKQYGLLPSRLEADDYYWLGVTRDMEWLRSKYRAWTTVGAKSMLQHLTPDELLYLSKLKEEAEEKYKGEDASTV